MEDRWILKSVGGNVGPLCSMIVYLRIRPGFNSGFSTLAGKIEWAFWDRSVPSFFEPTK